MKIEIEKTKYLDKLLFTEELVKLKYITIFGNNVLYLTNEEASNLLKQLQNVY
jgi:hypothetical protein